MAITGEPSSTRTRAISSSTTGSLSAIPASCSCDCRFDMAPPAYWVTKCAGSYSAGIPRGKPFSSATPARYSPISSAARSSKSTSKPISRRLRASIWAEGPALPWASGSIEHSRRSAPCTAASMATSEPVAFRQWVSTSSGRSPITALIAGTMLRTCSTVMLPPASPKVKASMSKRSMASRALAA
ncbi:hypothetical protein D3C80_1590620 [compost metagenome]